MTQKRPPRESANGGDVPATLVAGGEVDPIPGVGGSSPSEGWDFLPPSAAGEDTRRRAAGEVLPGGSRGFAKGGTGHPDLRPGFLYPLLRLPLTFRSAAQRSFAAKARGRN